MNSGWRYQLLAFNAAQASERFSSVSQSGLAESDFNAVIDYQRKTGQLTLYVSIKNRESTLGGQNWPKAIAALERIAGDDKNRIGPYCCVFGIAMSTSGNVGKTRHAIRNSRNHDVPYSPNTEVWRSDFFWPFFTNYEYQELMKLVLDVLIKSAHDNQLPVTIGVPDELITVFARECWEAGLVNLEGIFDDPYKLVNFFCSPFPRAAPKSRKKSTENR